MQCMVYEPTTSCARHQTEKREWNYEGMIITKNYNNTQWPWPWQFVGEIL